MARMAISYNCTLNTTTKCPVLRKMEAIAGLSLACNIIQVIETGFKVASICNQIKQHGSAKELDTLTTTSSELDSCCEQIQKVLRSTTNAKLQPDEQQLVDIAEKCEEAAQELRDELSKLAYSPGKIRITSLLRAGKLLLNNGRIQDLKTKLTTYQSALDTRMLCFLLKQCMSLTFHTQAANKETNEQLKSLMEKLDIILSLNQGEEHKCQEFIKLLSFPEMKSRGHVLEQRSEFVVPYDWLLDQSLSQGHSRPDLIEWLQDSDDDAYLIVGKPGSGKSTLMQYIVSNSRTSELLGAAQPSCQPLIAKFFFWNAGTTLEKNIQGLLRSVLCQILLQEPSCHPIAEESLRLRDDAFPAGPGADWSLESLKTMLKTVSESIQRDLVLFLDGFDEATEEQEDLQSLLQFLLSEVKIRLCISSRPIDWVLKALEGRRTFKVQDFTMKSIERYLRERLGKNESIKEILALDCDDGDISHRMDEIVNTLLERADGVFQWVAIVTRSIERGSAIGDSWQTLKRHLKSLPQELKHVYARMWDKYRDEIDHYLPEANRFFSMILHEEQSFLALWVADQKSTQFHKLLEAPIGRSKLAGTFDNFGRQILVRCAGFLDIGPRQIPTSLMDHEDDLVPFNFPRQPETKIAKHHREKRVRFIHRTAKDFVRDTLRDESLPGSKMSDDQLFLLLASTECNLWLLDPESTRSFSLIGPLRSIDKFRVKCREKSRELSITTVLRAVDLIVKLEGRLASMSKGDDTKVRYSCYPVAIDFLGAMADREGVPEYVMQQLTQESQTSHCLQYLLTCAMYEVTNRGAWPLVKYLLSQDTDPTINCLAYPSAGQKRPHRMSPWSQYLTTLPALCLDKDRTPPMAISNDWNEQIATLLEHGAQFDCTIPLVLEVGTRAFRWWWPGGDRWNRVAAETDIDFLVIDISVLSLLRWCFIGEPWYQSLEEKYGQLGQADHAEVLMVVVDGGWVCVRTKTQRDQLMGLVKAAIERGFTKPEKNLEEMPKEVLHDPTGTPTKAPAVTAHLPPRPMSAPTTEHVSEDGSEDDESSIAMESTAPEPDDFDEDDSAFWAPDEAHELAEAMIIVHNAAFGDKSSNDYSVDDFDLEHWTGDHVLLLLNILAPHLSDAEVIYSFRLPPNLLERYGNETWKRAAREAERNARLYGASGRD